jgi:hypothetical protein
MTLILTAETSPPPTSVVKAVALPKGKHSVRPYLHGHSGVLLTALFFFQLNPTPAPHIPTTDKVTTPLKQLTSLPTPITIAKTPLAAGSTTRLAPPVRVEDKNTAIISTTVRDREPVTMCLTAVAVGTRATVVTGNRLLATLSRDSTAEMMGRSLVLVPDSDLTTRKFVGMGTLVGSLPCQNA